MSSNPRERLRALSGCWSIRKAEPEETEHLHVDPSLDVPVIAEPHTGEVAVYMLLSRIDVEELLK